MGADTPTKEHMDGHSEPLAGNVICRKIESRFRVRIALYRGIHARMHFGKVAQVDPHEGGR